MDDAHSVQGESRAVFGHALTERLSGYSGRALAKKAHWGATVVNAIKSGRQLPSEAQLDDLLKAAGADDSERTQWRHRLRAAGENADLTPAATLEYPPAASSEVERREVARSPSRRSAALIVGLVLLVAVAVGVGALVLPGIWRPSNPVQAGQTPKQEPSSAGSSSTGPSSTGPSSTGPSSKGGEESGEISTPADGATAGSKAGVKLRGRITGGGTRTYWLVDQDLDGTYTADLPVKPQKNGTWEATDQPMGDPDDLPIQVTILLISADDSCASVLRRAVNADDSSFENLPKTCAVLDQIDVTVDRP